MDYKRTPVKAKGPASAIPVATQHDYTCAVKNDGALSCWGNNNYRHLGDGSELKTMLAQVFVYR